MIAYHPVTRLGQQAIAPGQMAPATPAGIPKWFKVALGTGLIVAGGYGGLKTDSRRPITSSKNMPELLAASGSIVGGIYILLEGLGVQL